MKYIIDIDNSLTGYFIILKDYHKTNISNDRQITEFLGISEEFYFDIAKQFNGYRKYSELYFKSKEDIINFKEWLENNIDYLLIAKKIEGK